METARIAQIIDEMGTLLEIEGENPFRCRAYHTAAQALVNLPADLTEMIADGSLKEVPGIGDTMHAKIVQLATTGQLPSYDELRRSTPPGLVALLRIPGLGPKKIKALHETLKIESLADLRAAGESGQIAKLKGFGAKTEAKILEGIAFVEKAGERILQSDALRLVAPILAAVRDHPEVIRAEVCGSLRRRAETIGDLDILFSSKHAARGARRVRQAAPGRHGAGARTDQGERPAGRRRAVRPAGGRRHPVPVRPPLLHRLEGPQYRDAQACAGAWAHAERICTHRARTVRSPARPRPSSSRPWGWPRSRPSCARISGEIEAAEAGRLPDLVELGDLTGTFHCHTDWSDGGGHARRDGRGRAGQGHEVPGNRRSLALGRLCRRAVHRAGPRAVGGDRRAQPDVRRQVSPLQGDRVRHPGRRLARLSRRAARWVRLRGGERPFEFQPAARGDDPTAGAGRRPTRGSRCSAIRPAGCCWPATAMPSISTRSSTRPRRPAR